MPRRPTGKRVPRDDGTFVVVNKAANQAGTVFHVPERRSALPDGRVRVKRAHWRATYRDPVSGQQRTVYAPTRDEVTRRREQALADSSPRSMRVGGRSTTAAFAGWWMTTYASRLRFGSVDKYRQRLGRLGPLADVPIGDVTPAQVADWQTLLLTTRGQAWEGEFDDAFFAQPAPDPAAFGLPTDDDGARDDPLMSDRSLAITRYQPDVTAIEAAPTRVVIAVGEESINTVTGRCAVAAAELLGQPVTVFPSHHGGFMGGEFGYAGQPQAFAARLRDVLYGS